MHELFTLVIKVQAPTDITSQIHVINEFIRNVFSSRDRITTGLHTAELCAICILLLLLSLFFLFIYFFVVKCLIACTLLSASLRTINTTSACENYELLAQIFDIPVCLIFSFIQK